jgi:hypothetical protein
VLGRHYEALKQTVDSYCSDVENGFLPELDTETFAWWKKRYESHYFSAGHLCGGLFLGVVIMVVISYQIDPGSTLTHPAVFLSVLLGSAILGSGLFWGLSWLCSRGWKMSVKYYQEQVRYWIRTPKNYRYLTISYLMIFILPSFWPEFGLIQLLGYLLICLTLEAAIVYVLMGGTAYIIALEVMELDYWAEIIPAGFALAGLLAFHTFFRLLRCLPAKLSVRITDSGVLLLLLFLAYSILATTALLQGILAIVNGFNISSINN